MHGYLGDAGATRAVMEDGWYLGLQDVGFFLEENGRRLFYWQSRRSNLLIRGGANYAYAQLEHELTETLAQSFSKYKFNLAVVGVKLTSEHEDDLCLTIETDADPETCAAISRFLFESRSIPKHARPQKIQFDAIPRNFKGAIQTKHLTERFILDLL